MSAVLWRIELKSLQNPTHGATRYQKLLKKTVENCNARVKFRWDFAPAFLSLFLFRYKFEFPINHWHTWNNKKVQREGLIYLWMYVLPGSTFQAWNVSPKQMKWRWQCENAGLMYVSGSHWAIVFGIHQQTILVDKLFFCTIISCLFRYI